MNLFFYYIKMSYISYININVVPIKRCTKTEFIMSKKANKETTTDTPKVDLRAQALAMVQAKVGSSTTRGDRKSLFHELLLNKKLDKTVVIGEIAYEVYMKEFPNATEIEPKAFSKITDSVKGSVANFCSASKRKSTATATYNWDPAFKEFELFKSPNGILEIRARETEFVTFE